MLFTVYILGLVWIMGLVAGASRSEAGPITFNTALPCGAWERRRKPSTGAFPAHHMEGQ